jgi:hypothetical protein
MIKKLKKRPEPSKGCTATEKIIYIAYFPYTHAPFIFNNSYCKHISVNFCFMKNICTHIYGTCKMVKKKG